MKILVLSPTFPLPAQSGAKRRIYHTIKELSKRNEIHLISLVQEEAELECREELEKICESVYPVKQKSNRFTIVRSVLSRYPYRVIKFGNQAFSSELRNVVEDIQFDIIWVNFMNTGIYLDHQLVSDKLIVLDQHNVDELVWRRFSENSDNFLPRAFGKLNARKHIRLRNNLLPFFDVILSVCREDADFMKQVTSRETEIWTVPNGVDINYFKPRQDRFTNESKVILFCGSMDVKMNIDAVTRFAENVFPEIKQRVPEAEFWVVGKDPVSKVRKLSNRDGIKVTGTVNDVRAYYNKAALFVAPFRFGGGTKLKILESMAMGVPIVSTNVGIQGINVKDGENVILANDADVFVDKVVYLLSDRDKQKYLSENAMKLAKERYSWENIISEVEKKLLTIIP